MKRDNPDRAAADLYENLAKSGWMIRRIARAVERQRGIPDAIVARPGPAHRNHLLEVKSLGGRLSEAQQAFARLWPGCVHVATSSWEADLLLKECETHVR